MENYFEEILSFRDGIYNALLFLGIRNCSDFDIDLLQKYLRYRIHRDFSIICAKDGKYLLVKIINETKNGECIWKELIDTNKLYILRYTPHVE